MAAAKPRCMSNVVYQLAIVFVITPGLQKNDEAPDWVYDMALAINRTLPAPYTPEEVATSKVLVDQSQSFDDDGAEAFILFDWSTLSRQPGDTSKPKVAGRLFRLLLKRLRKLRAQGEESINVHFIGHSRGAYVNARVLELMSQYNIDNHLRCISMTTLDPHSLRDGTLSANPGGIVDWQVNFYQTDGSVEGEIIQDGFNVDLTPVIVAWDGQTSSHSEVHAWYHWAIDWRDISEQNMNQKYKDPDVLAQQETLSAEASAGDETTRKLLFGSQPLFNPFALNKLTDVMGKYGAAERTDENALQLTTLEENIAGSAFMSEKISGDFVAEFTFFMKDRNDFAAADGFTFAVVKADQSLLGHTGGLLGYGGLSGFAVAFDTFYNPEHNDPLNPARRVSLRINGEPQWKSLSSLLLPEAANSGNRFRVRVKLLQEKLHVRVYSFGADKSVTYTHTFSPESVPSEKRVGFTASTGSGAQRHLIDDVLIMPLNSN